MPYTLIGDCTCLPGEYIRPMEEVAEDLDVQECRDMLGSAWEDLERQLGYVTTETLRLHTDFAVSCHRSRYDGKPCIYVDHSRIFYVYVQKGRP